MALLERTFQRTQREVGIKYIITELSDVGRQRETSFVVSPERNRHSLLRLHSNDLKRKLSCTHHIETSTDEILPRGGHTHWTQGELT